MRCNNCGWENPDGNIVCSKCGNLLEKRSSHGGGNGVIHFSYSPVRPDSYSNRESSSYGKSDKNLRTCAKCGYPATNYSDVCPWCGTAFDSAKDVFRLVSLEGDGISLELREGETVEIGGKKYRFEK
ncbi:MAG: zinc ribbon domain-containing protein [Bacteroidales bacterium]|nr:zinc ribbon domain-containing protein [Bacteroidales bacterium]